MHTEEDVKCSGPREWKGEEIAIVGFDGVAYGATVVKRAIKCGKKNCRKCPHGYYYYARYRRGEKRHEKYICKA